MLSPWLRAASVLVSVILVIASPHRDDGQDQRVLAAGLPDLQPVSLAISPPDATLFLGGTYTATFTVRNVGTGTASGSWVDELFLSANPTFESTDQPMANLVQNSLLLLEGDVYTAQMAFTVPSAPPGPYYVLLRTNVTDSLGEESLANNLLAVPVTIDYKSPPRPDLKPLGVQVTDGTLVPGGYVTLRYTVQNVGDLGTDPGTHWSDAIYFSPDDVFGSTDPVMVQAPTPGGSLSPGDTYTREVTATLPTGASASGYLIVSTDNLNELLESSDGNNALVVSIASLVPPMPTATATYATPGSGGDAPPATSTLVPTATPTETPIPTNTPAPTNTLVSTNTLVPTAVPSDTPLSTRTPVPPTATNTRVPATSTATPTATRVPPTPTATATRVPPTPTAASTPTTPPLGSDAWIDAKGTIRGGGIRVKYEAELRCQNGRGPNKLEARWRDDDGDDDDSGQRFDRVKLDALVTVVCQTERKGPFDVYRGVGRGHLDDGTAVNVEWVLADGDGKSDRAAIKVSRLNGQVIVNVDGPLANGRNTAHYR